MTWNREHERPAHRHKRPTLAGWSRLATLATALASTEPSLSAAAAVSSSSWLPNGTPVASTGDLEFSPGIAPDGRGGVFVSWARYSTVAGGIYALDVDAAGRVRTGWPADGLFLPELAGGSDPDIASGGAGEAFLSATSFSVVYFRHLIEPVGDPGRVSRSAPQSPALAGLPVGMLEAQHNGEMLSVVIPDGSGGAFVAFTDNQRFSDAGYVRHYRNDGSLIEASLNAITGCSPYLCFLRAPTLCSDAAGGVFVAWGYGCGARVLRLTSDLTVEAGWAATGVDLAACPMSSAYVGVCSDGSGGVYVAWQGYPTYEHPLRVHHLTASGTWAPGWPATSGIELSPHPTMPGYTRPYYGAFPSIVSDGAGGALVAWSDQRADTGDVYVQRVSPTGIAQGWPEGGRAVGRAPGLQQNPVVAADGSGGAIVAWQDERTAPDLAIFANHVDASGAIVEPGSPEGIPVSRGTGLRLVPRIVGDGGQGAFVAWVDYRAGNGDIYLSHFPTEPSVSVVSPPLESRLEEVRPNPTSGQLTCRVSLGSSAKVRLVVLDASGRVWLRRPLSPLGSGWQDVSISLPIGMPSGIYFAHLEAGSQVVSRRFAVVR